MHTITSVVQQQLSALTATCCVQSILVGAGWCVWCAALLACGYATKREGVIGTLDAHLTLGGPIIAIASRTSCRRSEHTGVVSMCCLRLAAEWLCKADSAVLRRRLAIPACRLTKDATQTLTTSCGSAGGCCSICSTAIALLAGHRPIGREEAIRTDCTQAAAQKAEVHQRAQLVQQAIQVEAILVISARRTCTRPGRCFSKLSMPWSI